MKIFPRAACLLPGWACGKGVSQAARLGLATQLTSTSAPGKLPQGLCLGDRPPQETRFPHQLLSHLSRSGIPARLLKRSQGAAAAARAIPVKGRDARDSGRPH